MTAAVAGFTPPRPPRRATRPHTLTILRAIARSTIGGWSDPAFANPVTAWRMLGRDYVLANHPAAIHQVLTERSDIYVRSPLARRLLQPALGDGLLLSSGADWQRQRRLLAPLFTPRAIDAQRTAMEAAIGRWLRQTSPATLGHDLLPPLRQLTGRIALAVLFGDHDAGIVDELIRISARYEHDGARPTVFDLISTPFGKPWPQPARRQDVAREWRAWIGRFVDAARTTPRDGADLLGRLATLRDPDTGEGLDREELIDQVGTFIAAGFETTAIALFWTLCLLAVDRDRQDVIRRGSAVTLRNVLRESMRLYPPAPSVVRQALADDTLLGTAVPAGAIVYVSPWVVHRSALHWPEPDTWRPDRFAGSDRPPPAWMPFGGGPRVCIGAQLALTELELALPALLRRFDFTLAPGDFPLPIGRIGLLPDRAPNMAVRTA